MSEQNHTDPIPAIERASAVAVNLYDRVSQIGDEGLRVSVLLLVAHLRQARKDAG